MKTLRWVGLGVGLILFVVLLRQVDFQWMGYLLHQIGWRGLGLLLYPTCWITFNTLGWRFAFHRDVIVPSFLRLTEIRLAGETFNSLLPSGYIGGEPIKIQLLSQGMPRKEAAASVLIAKAAQSVALVLFVGVGLCIPHVSGSMVSNRLAPLVALGILAAAVGLFLWLLAHQAFSASGRWLEKTFRLAWLGRHHDRLRLLDERLGEFYRHEKARFLVSAAWHWAAWVAGSMELYLIFQLIGKPLDWRDAWFMGAMAQLSAIIGLISPGGIGFYEGGHAMAAHLLGLGPEWGISVSLLRRMREMTWNLIGLGLFWRQTHLPADGPAGGQTRVETSSTHR